MNFKILTGFHQGDTNIAKAGAYYTDLAHCSVISQMFEWPEEEVCVLEPSIGDGSAVVTVTQAHKNPNIKIFGVDINNEVKKNLHVTELLHGDFLKDIKISRGAFSFCFANPPYGTQLDEGKRFEALFLEKIVSLLKRNAILVWVVPLAAIRDTSHTKTLLKYFDILHRFRFWESEFKKYNQVVLIARKREFPKRINLPEIDHFQNQEINVLPTTWEKEKIPVPVSEDTGFYFIKKELNWLEAMSFLECQDEKTNFFDPLACPQFAKDRKLTPPIPIKEDSYYLLSVTGQGQGLVGEEGHIHALRGNTKRVTKSIEESDGEKTTLIERQITQAYLTVIESDGSIKRLE